MINRAGSVSKAWLAHEAGVTFERDAEVDPATLQRQPHHSALGCQ